MVAKGAYMPRGAACELFGDTYPELLMEGPAGTGKTRAVLEKIHLLCLTHPGIRALICRATRASMTESVLVEMEDSVIWPGSGVVFHGGGRSHRTAYEYPNGSYIVVTGLDNPDRIMSAQYDLAAVFEATECKEDAWDKIQTRLRNNKLHFQQAIADCNPAHRAHWLNRRANREGRGGEPLMQRLLSRHEDNPTVTPEYLARLDNLTGARYERLRLGMWVDESGVILPEFDPAIHVVPRYETLNIDGTTRIKYYVGSMDWGIRNPGCLQVWGITAEDEMYRVEEVYYRGKNFEWWAEVVEEAYGKYQMRRIVCDTADVSGNISMLNDRLTSRAGRSVGAIAVGADKRWVAGRDLCAELLKPNDGSKPRMFFVNDAFGLRGIDKTLKEDHLPVCSEEELPGITWDEEQDGKPIRERVKPGVPDHGFDTTRYAAMHLWVSGPPTEDPKPVIPDGSIGDILGWGKDLGV